MSFDWQTEEDIDWDEQAWQDKPETAVPRKPPWRTLAVVGALLVVAGILIYQQVNKRLDAATANVETDIFAAHNLLSRAAVNQDADLAETVLSGRDLGWSGVQADLVANGIFLAHPGLQLNLPEETAVFAPLSREDDRLIELIVSPDLSEAELYFARDYLALTDDGLDTVTLQQTAVYRRGETRWLYAPPLAEFWGGWETAEYENLTIVYPRRDEEIVQELAEDLQDLLAESCDVLPELNCSPDTQIQIRFDSDPESLLETADSANLYQASLRLNLPTPSLIGLPINRGGYEALHRAYGANLMAALIADGVGYDCCRRAPIFQAIVRYQLAEMGLATWPVTQETQQRLANEGVHTEMLFGYWNSSDFSQLDEADSYRLYGFVDFLVKQFAAAQTPLQILDRVSQAQGYQAWLAEFSTTRLISTLELADSISADWWFYAITQAEATAVNEQPIPLPAQDLQIGCGGQTITATDDFGFPKTTLFRYQLESASWLEETSYPGLAFFNPLPNDDGVILQVVEFSEEEFWHTLWWHDGAGRTLMPMEDVSSISLGQMDPNGRLLLAYSGNSENEQEPFFPAPLLLDMDSCQGSSCLSTSLESTLFWSPDGQQTLLVDQHLFESSQFMIDGRILAFDQETSLEAAAILLGNMAGDQETAVEVAVGMSPFWISNDLFGYIAWSDPAETESLQHFRVMSTTSLVAETLLETADLQSHLPAEMANIASPLVMRYAVAHPTNDDLLFILASIWAENTYLFQVNRQTGEIDLLLELDLSAGEHSLGFSPDGRFLTMTGARLNQTDARGNRQTFSSLHLYDLQTDSLQTILTNNRTFAPSFNFDWSGDGNWLAFNRNHNTIGLIAPAYGYQQSIQHGNGECTSLAWINPLPSQ